MTGLVVHAIDCYVAERPSDEKVIGRISFDLLGVVGFEDFDIHVELLRPGRTIELLEAVVVSQGRPVIRARAWRLACRDTAAIAGGQPDRLPHPESLPTWPLTTVWPGEYIASLDVRPVRPPQPGRTTAWISTNMPLLDGESTSDLARYTALIDTANGIAVRRPPREWMFPNVDVTIHLFRQPEGRWVGLDTTVIFGSSGQGLTSTVLHDVNGAIGRAEQILTIRPRSSDDVA